MLNKSFCWLRILLVGRVEYDSHYYFSAHCASVLDHSVMIGAEMSGPKRTYDLISSGGNEAFDEGRRRTTDIHGLIRC